MTTETKPAATPATTETTTDSEDTLFSQAKEALTDAGEAISGAFDDVVDAAKKNPVAAAPGLAMSTFTEEPCDESDSASAEPATSCASLLC